MEQPTLTQRARGVVRWFDHSKGYGYIEVEGRDDIFVRYSNIESNGPAALTEGDEVSFLIEEKPTGPEAVRVVRKQ